MHKAMIAGCLLVMSRQPEQVSRKLSRTVLSGSALGNNALIWSLKRNKRAKIAPAAPFLSRNSNLDCSNNPNLDSRLELSMCQMQRPASARRRGRYLVGTIRRYDPLFTDDSVVGLKCRQDSSVQSVDVNCLDDGQPCRLSRRPVLSEDVVTAQCLPSDPLRSVIGNIRHISTVTNRLELPLDRLEQSSAVGRQKVLELLHQVLPTVLESSLWTVKNAMPADESLCLFRLTATALLGATL